MNLNYSEPKALPWAGLSGLFEAKHRIFFGEHRLFRPTACHKPAQGKRGTSAALGSAGQNGSKPQRGATNRASIPHVSFINLHAMFPAKRPELILIRHPAMMLLLRCDLGADLVDVRLAHRK